MDNLSNVISVLSANVRRHRDNKKCCDVLDYLKNLKSKIICLQDTHWVESDIRRIKTLWNGKCLINGKNTNSRGVTILLITLNMKFKIYIRTIQAI